MWQLGEWSGCLLPESQFFSLFLIVNSYWLIVQMYIVLEISRKCIPLTNVLLLLLLLFSRKQLAVILSLFVISLFLETVPLLYGINIYIYIYIYIYQSTMLCRFWTYSTQKLMGQGSVALTFDGKLMNAGLRIPIMCLKAHYMKLMLSMVAVSVTQIRAVIFVSDTINSESCNGQIFITYVENGSFQ